MTVKFESNVGAADLERVLRLLGLGQDCLKPGSGSFKVNATPGIHGKMSLSIDYALLNPKKE